MHLGDERAKKILVTFSQRVRDRITKEYPRTTGVVGPRVASRPILWKLLTARLLCRTVYNPRDPAVNIKNTRAYMSRRASQILASCFPPAASASSEGEVEISDGNSSWQPLFSFVSFFLSFFFLFLASARCVAARFYVSSGHCQTSARCHYTPHKAARHAHRISARNSESSSSPFPFSLVSIDAILLSWR